MDLYYCYSCGARVPEEDVLSGAATIDAGENRVLCKICSVQSVHDAPTGTDLRPIEEIPQTLPVRSAPRSSRSLLAVPRYPRQPAPAPVPAASKAPMLGLIMGAIMFSVAALIFLLKPAAKSTPSKTADDTVTAVTSPDSVIATRTSTGATTSVAAKTGESSPYRWTRVCVWAYDPDQAESDSGWLPLIPFAIPEKRGAFSMLNPNSLPAQPAVAVGGGDPSVLAKLNNDAFKGGKVIKDVERKGKDGRVVFGQKNPDSSMAARFDLKLPSNGPATIAASAYCADKMRCTIAVSVNGHEVFRGPEPGEATGTGTWSAQSFSVPTGIIQAGRNELRFTNVEPSAAAGPPQFMLSAVEIHGAPPAAPAPLPELPKPKKPDPAPEKPPEPTFPAVLSGDDRAALGFIENVFAPLEKLDIDASIRLASTESSPAGKRLVALLTAAKDTFAKAVAVINKGGGGISVRVTSGNLEIAGDLVRIDGGKAWIKSRGLEAPVELSTLPRDVFAKALAPNEKTAVGRSEKALLELALGEIDAASSALNGESNSGPAAELAAVLGQRAKLTQLQKFETELNELTALASSDRSAEVAPRIAKLTREYSELAEKHKQRIEYIANRAQAAVKK